jgi:hypothetical protein
MHKNMLIATLGLDTSIFIVMVVMLAYIKQSDYFLG